MEQLYLNTIKMSDQKTGFPSFKKDGNADKLNILLMDSSELILIRIKDILCDFEFIGSIETSTDIKNLHQIIDKLRPDVLAIDISTFEKGYIESIQDLKQCFPQLKIIMQTNLSEQYYQYYKWLFELVGADYFIDKSNEFDLLQGIPVSYTHLTLPTKRIV